MRKKILFFISVLVVPFFVQSQSVDLIGFDGWMESAYVKWHPVSGAESYNVYYSGNGISNKKIDNQLIRSYGSYFRADVLGISAGAYTIDVKPVISGVEGTATSTGSITVLAHDRTGFAFSNGRVPGAYKADGTPKDGAIILYITQNTKNSVSLNVTGANSNPCVGLQTILEGFKKGKDTRPLIIRLIGQITDLSYMDKGDIVIENKNNASSYITLEGVGDDAVADGWGIRIKSASNIEIRNIGTMNCDSNEGDNIGLQQDNDYVWVHHVDFFYGDAGGDSDQAKGDGALDSKRSGFVTFSYNHFWDTGKSNLLGNGTEDPKYLTYHHNWYDHSDSRHPRVRCHSVHVYNNYYDGNSKYGVGSTNASSVFVEANYFRNCKYPMLTSMQGSDIFYGTGGTFSSENGGTIKAFNNHIAGETRFVPYNFNAPTDDFDAIVVADKSNAIPSSIVSKKGGSTYNNFDTNSSVMYSYTPDAPEDVPAKVMQNAGRMFGGDFKWDFDNAVDDQSYAVNSALKSALTNYTTKLVSIQGDADGENGGEPGEGGGSGEGEEPGEITPGDEDHNFTLSGTNSTFYTISGNLSDSKGTVVYNGLTLTQCLKVESSTSIKFTLTETGTLTLIFNDNFSKKIKIDGVNYTAVNGILEVELDAGLHEITKGDTGNLFYMSLDMGISTNVIHAESEKISVYPNPVANTLHISSIEKVEKVEVYKLSGRLIKSVSFGLDQIDLSDLNQGSYLIVIHTQDGVFKKLILKK